MGVLGIDNVLVAVGDLEEARLVAFRLGDE
jgi:hypothetical protein